MGQQMWLESTEKIQISRKKLERNQKRIAELKRLFIKIYEDNAAGRLSDERFDMMSQSYEAEQKQLEAETQTLQQEIEVQERQHENIEFFIQKADKYVGIEKLTPYVLRELIQGIYVEAPDKSTGKRRQTIHIKYDGIGFIPLDVLMNGKTAWPKSRRFPRTPSSHDILNFAVLRPPCISSGVLLRKIESRDSEITAWYCCRQQRR